MIFFVTNFVTLVTKFVTRVRKFVIHVTNFVIKIICADSKKYHRERKTFLRESEKRKAGRRDGLPGYLDFAALSLGVYNLPFSR